MDRGATSYWSLETPSLQVQETKKRFVIPYPFNGGIRAALLLLQAASRKAIRQVFLYRFTPTPALCNGNILLTLLAHRVYIIKLLVFEGKQKGPPILIYKNKDERPVVPP